MGPTEWTKQETRQEQKQNACLGLLIQSEIFGQTRKQP
jgi:hypothetical protein